MTKEDIVTALREHAEWARANEWETPITLGDDLSAAADLIENQQREIEALRQANSALRDRHRYFTAEANINGKKLRESFKF